MVGLTLALLFLTVSIPSQSQTNVTTDNTSRYIGNNRWEWTVFIKADPGILSNIRCVEYVLHPTFPDRYRKICDRGPAVDQAFPITATGWGVFDIPVTVTFNDGKTLTLTHRLRFESQATAAPAGCNMANSFSIKVHEIQEIGSDWPSVYLYAEEIHQDRPSHFYLVKSSKAIQPGSFNWSQYSQVNGPRRRTSLSGADNNAYVKFSALPGTLFPLSLKDPMARIYLKDPQEHRLISVVVCR